MNTDQYAVVGHPIKHSLSPEIHRMFNQSVSHTMDYQKIDVEPSQFQHWVKKFFTSGGRGLNVTVPFKQEAFNLATTHSARALRAGAANTLGVNENGEIWADNTDGIGLVRAITGIHGHSLNQKNIVLLGAGGAVRGVIGELLEQNPKSITIANRTLEKATAIVDAFNHPALFSDSLMDYTPDTPPDWVISGLSSGLSQQLPTLSPTLISAGTHVYDMIYGPQDTPLITWAKELGAKATMDGLSMLVEQAAESFYLWRGTRPETTPVFQYLRDQLNAAG